MRRRDVLAGSALILTELAFPTWAGAQDRYEPARLRRRWLPEGQ